MKETQRRVYRQLAAGFIGIAAVFSLVAIAERLFSFRYFSGNVLPVTLFLGGVGLLLLQTVRQAEKAPDNKKEEDDGLA